MKTLKYILSGVILLSLLVSIFSFSASNRQLAQTDKVIFCETYALNELVKTLSSDEKLVALVQINDANRESSRIGICRAADLDELWKYIQSKAFKNKLPEDLLIAPGFENDDQMIPLHAVRMSPSKHSFPEQNDLEEVSVQDTEQAGNYQLYMSFSKSGADKWADMTRQNKGRDIAILFKGHVIAAPRVSEEIKNGKCVISGKYTKSEIYELKAALEN